MLWYVDQTREKKSNTEIIWIKISEVQNNKSEKLGQPALPPMSNKTFHFMVALIISLALFFSLNHFCWQGG